MGRIVEKLPVDSKVLDDVVESALCRGDIIQVCRRMVLTVRFR